MRFLLLTLALAAPLVAAAAGPASWMLDYQGKSTNQFIWDKRATPLVNSRVPSALADLVLGTLAGPPDPVRIANGRYASVAACRPHYCPEKGFLWVDTQTGAGLGAYYLEGELKLGSNSLSAERIPAPAQAALSSWLADWDLLPTSVAFIDRSGRSTALDASRYGAASFQPPASGPAFDCKQAGTIVETTICSDSGLAAQDLALSQLYKLIRHGSGTTDAQDQLQTLQRNWLKLRDQQCSQAADPASCLKAQYAAQHDKLNNWVPKPGVSSANRTRALL